MPPREQQLDVDKIGDLQQVRCASVLFVALDSDLCKHIAFHYFTSADMMADCVEPT
jgi:hypothetical protein